VSARTGHWGSNPFRIIADRPRSTSGTHLTDCPAGYVRVAIFTPAGELACSKFGMLDKGVVKVRLFEREEVDDAT
jgi:hypothetical protein